MVIRKGYKQTEVGVIPEDWDCREINSEIKEISMGPFGSDIPVSCFTSEGVPVLNGHSVSKIKLIDIFKNYVSKEKAKSLKKAVAQQGDIIVTHRGTIGQISYIPIGSRYKKYVISQSQFRVRLNQDTVNPHFVVSYFLSPKGQSFLLEKKGHTGVPALAQPTTNFRKLCIPLPSLPEQEQIVNAFEDIDDLILSLEKHISKKKSIKQGAMQELLTGKRRLPGFSGKWRTEIIPDVLQKQEGIKIGPFGSQLKKEYLLDDGPYRVYGQENVYAQDFTIGNRYLNRERFRQLQSCEVRPGDFLISTMGTIGKCAIVPNGIHSGIMDSHLIRLRINEQKLMPEYLLHLFSEELGYLKGQTSKLSVGGIMDGLSTKIVNALNVFYPEDLSEQKAIAEFLSTMNAEIQTLEQKLEKYRQVKQGMMQQLLTGKIRLV